MSQIYSQSKAQKPLVILVANLTWTIYHYRLYLIQALQKAGYEVMVLAPHDSSVEKLKVHFGVKHRHLAHFSRNSTNPVKCLAMMREFYSVYRRYKPAMVIHFGVQPNVFGNLGAAMAGVNSICVVTGLGYSFLHKNLVGIAVRMLYAISFLFAQKVLTENSDDQELLINSGLVRRRKTAVVNGCGIKLDDYVPQKKSRAASQSIVFTYIGRLLYDKGLYEFVSAAKHIKTIHPNACFQILGMLDFSNPAHIKQEELDQWVKSGVIRYLGAVNDVRPIIADSDWIVLPSYREGLSRTLLEAMSMARPIVTTDVAGCRQAVDDHFNGFLVPVRDTASLKEIFEKCCTLPRSAYVRMGKNGRLKAHRQFSHEIVDEQYLNLVEEVLDQKRIAFPFPALMPQLSPMYN